MSSFRVNETETGETLYYLEDLSILFLIKDTKIFSTITGPAADYLYKKLSCKDEKKKLFKNMKGYDEILYKHLSKHMETVLTTVANYENKILSQK